MVRREKMSAHMQTSTCFFCSKSVNIADKLYACIVVSKQQERSARKCQRYTCNGETTDRREH